MGIAEARETVKGCRYCFMCRYACPTFLATKLESVTPRGYALLLMAIDSGQQQWTNDIISRFFDCSLCGRCREDCEYDWPEDELVRRAREEIVSSGLAPKEVQDLRKLLSENDSNDWADLKNIAAEAIGMKEPEVLYLAGCQTREKAPEIIEANAKILSAVGVNWGVLEQECCCGAALYDLGYIDDAKKAAKELADAVTATKPGTLIVGCPHCYRSLKEFYAEWQVSLPKNLRVLHTSEYYAGMLSQGKLKLKNEVISETLAYHDPCQLGRKLNSYEPQRKLIEAVGGAAPTELFHNRESAECCGAGSASFIVSPETATKVARLRLDQAAEKGTNTLVTACQNCKILFRNSLSDHSIKVMDLSELLALNIS